MPISAATAALLVAGLALLLALLEAALTGLSRQDEAPLVSKPDQETVNPPSLVTELV